MIELHHVKLGLVKGCIGGHLRIVHVLNLDEGALSALTTMSQHVAHSEDALAESALSNRV